MQTSANLNFGSTMSAVTSPKTNEDTKKALEMSLNSVQFNRLINKKRNIETGWNRPTYNQIS